jgi:hypothetical protein
MPADATASPIPASTALGTIGSTLLACYAFYRSFTWTRRAMAARGGLFGGMAAGPDYSNPDAPAESSAEASPAYEPTIADVLVVKAMLHKAFALPPEIVDAIADHAELWPHTTARLSLNELAPVAHGSNHRRENVFLVTRPLLAARQFLIVADAALDGL